MGCQPDSQNFCALDPKCHERPAEGLGRNYNVVHHNARTTVGVYHQINLAFQP
ncbi:hypothetical protein PISMIDRAFT_676339 [Pisolithus microcarpus 441]|uniref:Uncharacterized protein n=1 Tax=Pisolithus microcarpus 441 TaxID=765257 RepID=A0A0C9YMG1_9AGAM|nr:hypothetical protein PISMIDRAFT_676339 [Pisolithus microcarpus 441]